MAHQYTYPDGSEVVTLLDNANIVGLKDIWKLNHAYLNHTWQTKIDGTPSVVDVDLEGSLDGVNFFALDTSTSTTGEMRHIANKAVKFIRINLVAFTFGGTSPLNDITITYLPSVK